jgi:hypothetical protein
MHAPIGRAPDLESVVIGLQQRSGQRELRRASEPIHLRSEIHADRVKDDAFNEAHVTIESANESCEAQRSAGALEGARERAGSPKSFPDQIRITPSSPEEAR